MYDIMVDMVDGHAIVQCPLVSVNCWNICQCHLYGSVDEITCQQCFTVTRQVLMLLMRQVCLLQSANYWVSQRFWCVLHMRCGVCFNNS